ncbi:MAG: hydrogenase formation protein HypD [Clostridiales Family XIII bacterium]|jgi:hydrogenase expression/formation protein HypD|nr:hydrogenase formation protein HypD [Clostridiales Family XIII bacterium]
MNLEKMIDTLRDYSRPVKIMEVCGSHTAAIMQNGIHSLLSPNIRLVSGPGCPVCVTSPQYIDALVDCAFRPKHEVISFGDMFKVPGTKSSLSEAKASGGAARFVYSPFDVLTMAKEQPDTQFVVAAVGFETTAPVYAALLEKILAKNIQNVKMLSALKTMPGVLSSLCEGEDIDGFIAPGHVAAIIGLEPFSALAAKHRKPFAVAGFDGVPILSAIFEITRQISVGQARAVNLYKSVVREHAQATAAEKVERYFEPCDAVWRGIGKLSASGLQLRAEYAHLAIPWTEAEDVFIPSGCRCGEVITGKINPPECPLYGSLCDPLHPIGACMVSAEGCCANWYAFSGGGEVSCR